MDGILSTALFFTNSKENEGIKIATRSKFNVSSDASKRTHDGIVFDSALEMKFYRDWVLPKMESGEILSCERQVKFELQPKFIHDAKTVLPITYVADFVVEWADGEKSVLDTKGMPDSVARIKQKLFWYVYPTVDYRWITYVKKFGGWIDYSHAKQCRKEEKKSKEKV